MKLVLIMGANDDLDGKTTYEQLICIGFCIQIIKGQKFSKPAIHM